MPIYEYSCPSCGHTKEIYELMSEHKSDKIVKCTCGKHMKQEITGGKAILGTGAKTLGFLAELNADRLSADEKESYFRKQRDKSANKLLKSNN